MRGFEDLPEPSDDDLAEIESGLSFDAYEEHVATDDPDAPDGAESARDRLHRNARDMTRIEHDTVWAYLSGGSSFLGPKEARDDDRERSRAEYRVATRRSKPKLPPPRRRA